MEGIRKKRCRKSYLEQQKYLDSDDDIAQMQEEIEETIASINPRSILSKLGSSRSHTNSLVDVEVEEFNEDVPEIQQVEYTLAEVNNTDSESIDQTEDVEITCIENPPNNHISKINKITSGRYYKLDENLLRAEIDSISETTDNKADKLIQIYTRNYYGRIHKYTGDGLFNLKLQDNLKKWRVWYRVLPDKRDSPSMYICYICNLGWWHFSEFRDHIKQHNDFQYMFHSTNNEYKMIACHDIISEFSKISFASNCWKCGKDVSAHLSPNYKCKGCEKPFDTCSSLSMHEGDCDLYKNIFKTLGQNTSKSYKCLVCPYKHWLRKELHRHMLQCHSVRSDIPLCLMTKECARCSLYYHDFNMHECLHRPMVASCSYCSKLFQTNETLELHLYNSKPNTPCRICGIPLERGCMEIRHLLKHTRKYIMMFKCFFCTDLLVFHDFTSIKQHIHRVHKIKRGYYVEKVIIPKSLLDKTTLT